MLQQIHIMLGEALLRYVTGKCALEASIINKSKGRILRQAKRSWAMVGAGQVSFYCLPLVG